MSDKLNITYHSHVDSGRFNECSKTDDTLKNKSKRGIRFFDESLALKKIKFKVSIIYIPSRVTLNVFHYKLANNKCVHVTNFQLLRRFIFHAR